MRKARTTLSREGHAPWCARTLRDAGAPPAPAAGRRWAALSFGGPMSAAGRRPSSDALLVRWFFSCRIGFMYRGVLT